jgi:transposase
MSYWSQPVETRDQLILFPHRLDESIPPGHPVRLLDEVLGQLDWSGFEAWYHGMRGQPPIHPRVLSGVILYGFMTRIRSTRALEDALQIRLDFRWLVEGRSIDHSTLSKFRHRHGEQVRQLFIQVGLVARQAGMLPLEMLAFDGTRVRANSRRSGTRTPAELKAWKAELAAHYEELEQRLAAEDARDAQRDAERDALCAELADTAQRKKIVEAALAELARVEATGETVPSRLPLTDPQSRVTPNKHGGFAPNYTPLATVDADSGLIVACDVIAMTNEDHHLISQLDQVQADYQLAAPPSEMLADGLMGTKGNLRDLQDRGVTLYCPSELLPAAENPATRADPTQPVPEELWDRLPSKVIKLKKGENPQISQLSKESFLYDATQNCFWCPVGKKLTPQQHTKEKLARGEQMRTRYRANPTDCADCPLRARCLQGNATRREVSRYENESLLEELAERMTTPEAQAKYARRRHVSEWPFAVIKQQWGARQFLLRGLHKVRIEWRWLAMAFNLWRLIGHHQNRAGPTVRPLPLLRS